MLKMITINVQGDTDTEGIQTPTAQIQKKKKKSPNSWRHIVFLPWKDTEKNA